jgi:hypothetical protein
MMATLLLGCGFLPSSQSAEANHRKAATPHRWKATARHKPPATPWTECLYEHFATDLRNQVCSVCRVALYVGWQKLQDAVFGMRTRRSKWGTGRRACRSTTCYVTPSHKRGACVGRKRLSARHRWTRLLFLATISNGPMAAHAFAAGTAKQFPTQQRFAASDSDSVTLRVDNCCTASITNSLADVVGKSIPIKARIEGFTGGKALVTARCAVKWRIEDDHGRVHTLLPPNSLCSQAAPFRLLSPQHWSQQANDHKPKREGTWCGTLSDRVELEWKQCWIHMSSFKT